MQLDDAMTDGTLGRLLAFIDEGNFGSGDRLPSERSLIERLGVSRSSLRHALHDLEQSGVIWRHVGKGTFLTGSNVREQADDPVLALARRTAPVKMIQARIAIEPSIAREAAINASAEALDRIAAARAATHQATSWELYETADDDFHRAVAEAADNLPLLAIFDRLNLIRRSVTWGNVQRATTRPPEDHASFAEHATIETAIAAHDPEQAQQAMRAHLKSVTIRLFGDL